MPKEDWGVKRLCPTTGKRFYDMNRSPIVSPYTGDVVEIETGRKSTVALAQSAKASKAAAKAKAAPAEEEEVVLEDDTDSDVDLGDDVLDDDDDNDDVSLDDIKDVASEKEDD